MKIDREESNHQKGYRVWAHSLRTASPSDNQAFSGFLRFSFASLSALNFISSPREPEGAKLQESDGLLTRSAPKRKGAKTVDAPPKRSGPDQTSAEE